MKKKEFKAESKKLMDLMINSIYTNKEIFLRELISNASDAIDKLHYLSLTDKSIDIDKKKLAIKITYDKDSRSLTISDNGIGMSEEELMNNLGTIAKSGSLDFKNENDHKKNIDIIGQFGVGFYSAFMVADNVKVISKKYGEETAYLWESSGIDGYTIKPTNKDSYGTDITLRIKEDTEDEEYSQYIECYTLKNLIKKYSDYITYPIKMDIEHINSEDDKEKKVIEEEIINSLIPLWKRNKSKVSEEDYNTFYSDKFFDYEKPLAHVLTHAEGKIEYDSLLYIPSHAPYDYYTKEYEKGLQLYSNGVLIMEKCGDLLPDYFSFVKGVVDSPDLSLNISREILQQNKVLKTISTSIESKIKKELLEMMQERPEDYEKFFKAFGMQIKYGVYDNYGMNKENLKDLLLFHSSIDNKLISLSAYIEKKADDQKNIYYACGESIDKIDLLPQVESVKEKGFDILYCTDYIDEFVLKALNKYADMEFINVCANNLDVETAEDKEIVDNKNKEAKEMFDVMKEALSDIKEVRFTSKLKNHPVCLSTDGEVSIEMEKALNSMPFDNEIKASKILEINKDHEIVEKLNDLYKNDLDGLKDYAKVLYAQARLIEGMSVDNPTELTNIICSYLAK